MTYRRKNIEQTLKVEDSQKPPGIFSPEEMLHEWVLGARTGWREAWDGCALQTGEKIRPPLSPLAVPLLLLLLFLLTKSSPYPHPRLLPPGVAPSTRPPGHFSGAPCCHHPSLLMAREAFLSPSSSCFICTPLLSCLPTLNSLTVYLQFLHSTLAV